MKLKHQIRIDKYIGLPVAYVSNVLIRIAGQLLRPDHSLDREFKTIAVSKYKGLGSIVQCTPLLQTLRHHYPDARIIFVSTEGNRPLLEKLDCVDEILTVRDSGLVSSLTSIMTLIIKLWKRRVGVFLDLEIYSNASSLITSFSVARNRMGYYLRSSNYRMGMYTHMMFYNIQSPISQAYLQFARLLGCREIRNELYSLKGRGKPVEGLKGKYIVVNVNASDLRIERRWDGDNFISLIEKLVVTYPDHRLVLIGNDREKEYVDELFSRLNNRSNVLNFAGKTDFDQLLGLMEEAEVLITNDTGPMHLGFALGIKIVALFGPCSPVQYGNHENAAIVYKNVYCSPCVHEFETPPCKGNNQCMKLIKVEEVMEVIGMTLEDRLPKRETMTSQQVIYQSGEGRQWHEVLGIVSR